MKDLTQSQAENIFEIFNRRIEEAILARDNYECRVSSSEIELYRIWDSILTELYSVKREIEEIIA